MFVIAIGIAALFLQPAADVPVDAAWLGIWIVAGLPTGFALLWAAGGKKEVLLIDGSRLTLQRRALVFARSRVLDAFAVRGLRVARLTERTSNRRAIRQFWTDDAGSVQFDCEGRTYGFGVTLTEAEATNIVAAIAARFPYTTAVVPDPAVLERAPRWRRWALAYVTFMLFVPVTIPIRILVQDRETCFGGEAEPPEDLVEVSSLRAVGRVLLVPIDEFPPETANAVAHHYRREFGTPIDVAPAITAPPDAYEPVRRQSSAGALIANLERLDSSSDVIVIGLTESDMYIPGVNWRYAFSFRRGGRFAIVSTARMHRGCLGLMRASEDRQMKRLRKMVGKNIGVMYYRLPLSRDRRSLMYAYVGGPQELDGMSEQY
jgi:predicted Zn-dependent protease